MVELEFDLFALPTAQHKAGLAGLLLLHGALQRRGSTPLPEVIHGGTGRVTLKLDESTLRTLINEMYDVAMVEKPQEAKREEIAPVRIYKEKVLQRKTGKEKTVTKYVYEDPRPRGQVLKDLGMPEIWLRLWQDAIWSTLRGIPKTRTPYEERQAGKDANEGRKLWVSLQRAERDRAQGALFTEEISSSIFIGAQASTPEKVPFMGRPEENLLLHFWPLVSRVFVPEVVDREGKSELKGYVFAVPEVADLEGFLAEYPHSVAQLGNTARWYVPSEAVITLPEEGALEFARGIHAMAKARVGMEEVAFTLTSVETYSLEKRGNSIKTLSAGRLPLGRTLLVQYEAVRRRYRHPIFMAQVLRNLLTGEPLLRGFTKLFECGPKEWYLGGQSTFPRCARDLLTALSVSEV